MHAPSLRAQDLLRADWTDATRLVAYRAAAVVAAVYTAGLVVGEALHQLNQQLAAAYRCLLVGHERTAAALEQLEAATDAYVEAAVAEAIDLPGLTVRELRTRALALGIKKAGGRRTCSATKAQLLAALA
jgi:kynureninase